MPNILEIVNKFRSAKRVNLTSCEYLKSTTKLRDYQTIGVAHLVSLPRMVLGDGVGLGKTIQIIVSYAYRLSLEPDLKLLVVTPKSAMEQWKEEIEKFCINISSHVLTNQYLCFDEDRSRKLSGLDARMEQYKNIKDNVLICNYRAIQEDYNFIIENRLPNYMVVFDEVQEIKNDKTKTWFAANMIASQAKYVYGVSATLIKNKLEEAYNIYRVIVPGLFPGKIKFHNEYIIKKKMSIWRLGRKRYFNKIVGYKNLDKFKEIIYPYFLMRKTQEVASELPKLISRKLTLEMTPAQDQLYKKALSGDLYREIIKDKFFKLQEQLSLGGGTEKDYLKYEELRKKYEESLTKEGLLKNKIAALSYCQLVSNGPGWINEEGESSKEIEFKRLFEQELTDEKTIVFTRFKSGISRLAKILDEINIKYVKITGDEDVKERTEAKKKFQDLEQDYKVIFITQAGSAAINLQAAGVILYYDTPWSYGDLYQSIGRAQRIGSLREHILLLHIINKGTIDEHVIRILESKKELINEVMGDIASGAIEFDNKEILFKDDESSIDILYNSVFGVKTNE